MQYLWGMERDLVPAFAALAHPQRLAVVRLLMRHAPGVLPAGEIATRLGLPPSTLSGHLAQLREAGLITQDRRGTSLLYAASVTGAEALTTGWIGAVCGGRGWPEVGAPGPRVRTLVVLGRGNAGPSLMAEALLRAEAGAYYEVLSAGVAPQGEADPAVLDYLAGQGHDVEALWAKPLSAVTGPEAPRPDVVIALGHTAAGADLVWPGCPLCSYWRLPPGLSAAALDAELRARIAGFAGLDPATVTPADLLRRLDAVAGV
ncbi:MAG: metalloregulator ArsR/SmtB family transcription factor [Rhodobacter sp.]|nr:metalloregulator ArsR/SmtB family transcription factor [Paracoccaceae bacterium]MCC0075015.1 metalloregulator ArsR/SmtB family transcription factor [Rhodobacter sp.]